MKLRCRITGILLILVMLTVTVSASGPDILHSGQGLAVMAELPGEPPSVSAASAILTDENGRACELMIFFPEGSASERDRLQTELEKELGIVVHIFLERRDEDAAERKENTENG